MRNALRLVAAFLAVSLIAAGCGDSEEEDRFSQPTRDGWMNGCVENGNEAFCECTLDELEKVFTESEFIEFILETDAADLEEPPEELLNAILACTEKLDPEG